MQRVSKISPTDSDVHSATGVIYKFASTKKQQNYSFDTINNTNKSMLDEEDLGRKDHSSHRLNFNQPLNDGPSAIGFLEVKEEKPEKRTKSRRKNDKN